MLNSLDNEKKKKYINKRKSYGIELIYIIIFLTIFLMTEMTPFQADEYNYSNFIWTNNRIKNLSDIIKSQVLMYKLWSGRVLIHTLIQVLLFIGKNMFNILNSLVFLSLVILIKEIAKIKSNIFNITLIFVLLWLFIPIFPETTLWLSGSLNYMWPGTLMIYLIYRLDKLEYNKLTLIISFIVGASQENTSILINGFILYYLLKEIVLHKKIDINLLKSFFATFSGMIFLFIAPGNFKRSGGNLSFNLKHWVDVTFNNNFLFLVISVLLIINILIIVKKLKDKSEFIRGIEYFMLAILSLLPMIILNEYPLRATYSAYLLIILSLILLFKILSEKEQLYIILIAIILVLPNYLKVINWYNVELRNSLELRKIEILNLNKNNNYIIPIKKVSDPEIAKYNLYGFSNDLAINPYSITNFYFARYYNIEKVYGLEKENDILKVLREPDKEKNMEVFWDSGNGYNINESYRENPYVEPSKNQLMETEAYFSIPKGITKIRIDIGSNPGIKKIKRIEIFNKNMLIKIKGDELKEKITNKNQIDKIYLENDILILESIGNDPYIELEI